MTVQDESAQSGEDLLAQQQLLAFHGATSQPLSGPWAKDAPGDKARLEITFADAARNILVLGATGSGKTVTAIEPAIRAMIDQHCSGLILTTKDADIGLVADFPDRTVVIGASSLARPVNLIGGMPVETLEAFFEALRSRLRSQRDPYWGSRAVVYGLFVYETLGLMGRHPTLACIYDALAKPSEFVALFDPWIETQPELPQHYHMLLQDVLVDSFSILVVGGSRHAKEREVLSLNEPLKQYSWQTLHFLPLLRPFAANGHLRSKLCEPDGEPLDLAALMYGERKVIVSDVPYRMFGTAAHVVNEVLRLRMRHAVLDYRHHRRDGYGRHRFTFMVIDEFQQHLNLAPEAASSGLLDDNTWFDRSREYGHINIVATQGLSSLEARVPGEVTVAALASLLQNFGTTVCFATHDAATLGHLATHAGAADRDAVRTIAAGNLAVGEALVVSHQLARHDGAVIAHVRGGAIYGAPQMTYGFRRSERSVPADRFEAPDIALPNPLLSAAASETLWDEWFERYETVFRLQVDALFVGEPVGMMRPRPPWDPRGRRTWLSSEVDRQGWLWISLERESPEVFWRVSLPFENLIALCQGSRDLIPAERFEELDAQDVDAGEREPRGGWEISPLVSGFRIAGWRIETPHGTGVGVDVHDWQWIRDTAERWSAIVDAAREALDEVGANK